MLRDIISRTAGHLYTQTLQEIGTAGHEVEPLVTKSSPSAAHKTYELIAARQMLTNPRARVIYTRAREINLGFCLGNFFYQLMNTDAVDPVAYYNVAAHRFSDDGQRLHGTYGTRIHGQLKTAARLLMDDPATRRAVITIFDGRIDHQDSKDIPCPTTLQFLVRGKGRHLHCIASFRSQNSLMVYPYDIFLFTMLHEFMAVNTGYLLGSYIQLNGSVHYYENEVELVDRVLDSAVTTFVMPQMTIPGPDQWEHIMFYEQAARAWGSGRGEEPIFLSSKLDHYWSGICRWLHAYAKSHLMGEPAMRNHQLLDGFWKTTARTSDPRLLA